MRSLLALVFVSTVALGAAAGCSHDTSEAGETSTAGADLSSVDRGAIMDALRAVVKPELGNQDIVFVVNQDAGVLRTAGNYAWLQGHIQLRNGGEPTTKGTQYEEDAKEGLFDGFRVEALIRKEGNRWVAVEHGVGTTDVWYEGIDQRYPDAPKSIFPWLDAGANSQSLAPSERLAVMDGLRSVVKPELNGQDIVFNVRGQDGVFRVQGDWAWMQGSVQLRTGGDPTTNGTQFQTAANEGIFDGFHIEALLHRVGGTWTVVDHGVGSTDVWWDGIWDRHPDAPRAIFPMLDGK